MSKERRTYSYNLVVGGIGMPVCSFYSCFSMKISGLTIEFVTFASDYDF